MEEKIDRILERVGSIDVTIAKLEKEVTYHIKRTDILEAKVNKVWYLVLLGAGAGATSYGSTILKLIGLL